MRELKYYIIIMGCILFNNAVNAQKKESAEAYIERMRNLADSIKKVKKEGKNNTKKESGNLPTRFSAGKYSTNKITIDNAYKYLSVSEKEIVKDYPQVPEAFRTDVDAKQFIEKLNGKDINADIQKYAKQKSISLVGYLVSFNKTKSTAESILAEAKTLKTDFERNNPKVKFGEKIGKTFVGENALVYLPLAEASFADEVFDVKYVNGNTEFPNENVLHAPDYVLMKDLKQNKGIYSLGLNGSLTIKFSNNALIDVNGPDLFVFEAGEIEPTNIEISKDGKTWVSIGKIEGGTSALDIKNYVKPNDFFYYVKLTDLNTKSQLAGADIDAIAAIGTAIKLDLNAEVLFDIGKADLKPEGIAAIKKLAITLQSMTKAKINIEGFTDDIGNDNDNIKLSLQRAKAVSIVLQKELKNNIGFEFKEDGKGKSNPAVPNTSDENRKKNRRVEILVTPI
jgi:outer membrane protein OmpA-like peptidoglycan-associated protein